MKTKFYSLLLSAVVLLCNSCGGSDDPDEILQGGSIYTVEFTASGENYSATANFVTVAGIPMIDVDTGTEFYTTLEFTGKKTYRTKAKTTAFAAGAVLSSKFTSILQMTVKKDGEIVWVETASIYPGPEDTQTIHKTVAYATSQ